MCPWGEEQIQTSRHAGGIASERILASVLALVTGVPSALR
jgi:hypothetical protein